jgi:hypothetical protein
MTNAQRSQAGQIVGRGASQRVSGTPEQERARGERNARMQAITSQTREQNASTR